VSSFVLDAERLYSDRTRSATASHPTGDSAYDDDELFAAERATTSRRASPDQERGERTKDCIARLVAATVVHALKCIRVTKSTESAYGGAPRSSSRAEPLVQVVPVYAPVSGSRRIDS